MFFYSKSDEEIKDEWQDPPSMIGKENCLRCILITAFTVQIFATSIKFQGLNCEPDCMHIGENVNQVAAELKP